MKGFFARVGDTFSRVSKQINDTIDSVKNSLSQFSSLSYLVLSSDTVRKGSYNFFERFWSGFSLPWDPIVVPALLKSPKSRKVLLSSFWHNVLIYGGTAFIYELTKNQINYYYPEMKDSWSEYAIDWGAYAYLINQGVERTLDNMLGYNGAIATSAYEENPNQGVTTPCSHNRIQQVRGDLTEPIYYLSDVIALKLLILVLNGALPSVMWPLARLLVVPYKALVMGKCLTEYKFGEDKCTEHRERLFSQNKAHLFGYGLSLAMAVEFWNLVIYYFTGVRSAFIDDALTSLLGQGYIFVSYTRDKPLPDDEKKYCVNLLKYNHIVAASITKDVGEIIIPRLANPKMRGPLIRFVQQIYSLPITGWVMKIMLPKNFQSVETIVKMPGINLHLKYKKDKIENLLQGFQAFRESYGASAIIYLPTIIVGENIQNIIKCAMRKEWDDVIKFVEYVLHCAEFEPEPVNVKWHVTQDDYQRMLEAPQLPRVNDAHDEIVHYDDEANFVKKPCENSTPENAISLAERPIADTPPPDYPAEAELTDMIQLANTEQKKEEVSSAPVDFSQDNDLVGIIHYSDDEAQEDKNTSAATLEIVEDYTPAPVKVSLSKSGLFHLQALKVTSCASGNFQEFSVRQN